MPDQIFKGDDRFSDHEAGQILRELRSFVDSETVDGEGGIAWGWDGGYVSIDELRETLERFHRLRVLVQTMKAGGQIGGGIRGIPRMTAGKT